MPWEVLINITVFIALYFVAYGHNEQNSGHPFDKYKEIKIKRFSRLFWFKDKQKRVVKYCWLMQLHCIIASAVFILIWIGCNVYKNIAGDFDMSLPAKIMIGYMFANILIIVGYIFWGAMDEFINRKKRERKHQII